VCAIVDNDDQLLSLAATYLAEGLRAGEQAMYVARSAEAQQQLSLALEALGVDVTSAIARQALIQATHAEAHLAEGYFSTERMLRLLNDAVEGSLNAGFTGLRACGDMSWLLAEPRGAEQVVEYEALLNQFFRGARGLAMCVYNSAVLPAHLLDHALATHSTACLEGRHISNPYYEDAAGRRTPQPERTVQKLRVLSELATSSAAARLPDP
jgi:hypothetical protein